AWMILAASQGLCRGQSGVGGCGAAAGKCGYSAVAGHQGACEDVKAWWAMPMAGAWSSVPARMRNVCGRASRRLYMGEPQRLQKARNLPADDSYSRSSAWPAMNSKLV